MLNQQQIQEIRGDFPYLNLTQAERPLVYLDNAATTQKPQVVIDSIAHYYAYQNANPHRGAHLLADAATSAYENARMQSAKLIHAYRAKEIIFTRNATESLNLLAYSLGLATLRPGDEILISILEHHANILPWQFVCEQTGATLRYVYLDANQQLSVEAVLDNLTERTKILSLTACSNVTGTRPRLAEIFARAKERDIRTIADLSQLVPHAAVDVRELHCDFAVFSAHKMYAGMGLGILWGKYELLSNIRPFLLGGDMIERVTEQSARFLAPAARFEAGTMNVGAAVSLTSAINYLNGVGWDEIDNYEQYLTNYALENIQKIPHIDVLAVKDEIRGSVLPFNIEGVHPHDVASILNNYGIAVRAGHHCAEPLHQYWGINATCRASFSFYNTIEEVDYFLSKLPEIRKIMHLN